MRWPDLPLGEAGKWRSGGTPSTTNPDYWGGDIPWISSGSLIGTRLSDSERRLTPEGAANGTSLVDEGAILFVVRGMSLKSEFRVGRSMRRLAFGQDCKAIVVDRAKFQPEFLTYALKALEPVILGMVDEAGHGTGRLDTGLMEGLEVPMPDLATQTAIADVLGALDDKIAANERVLRLGDDFLRSRFAQLVHSAEDWVPLSHYLALRYGKSLPSTQRRSGEVPVVGSGGPSGMHDESLVEGPGIVVGRKGSIGTVWWCDRDFWPIDTAFFVEPLGGTGLRFAYSLLRWVQLGEHNGDSAVPGLNRDVALAQPVPRVAAELAEDFEALATPIMNLSQGLREETARLAATRDALLPELMSGRLTVGEVA